MRERAKNLLRSLSNAHGAPGHEDDVRAIAAAELSGTLRSDRNGSLIHEVGSTGPRIMVTAHMDEVGFAVQSITAQGLLRFVPLGGWWTHVLPGQRVRVKTRAGDELVGVIGATPLHLLSEEQRKQLQRIEDLYIDVGATDAQAARELGVRLGDPVVPDVACTDMANGELLLGKAMDNRVGCALALQAAGEMAAPTVNTVLTVLTSQEEVGTRGATTAAAATRPDLAIVLEGPPADDLPGTPADEHQGALGKGPQVRLMDPTAISNRGLVRFFLALAEGLEIPVQETVRRSGGTDARAIHLHEQGVPSIVLGVPARYIHTPQSVVHLGDYVQTLQLLLAALPRLDAGTVEGFTTYCK